ncbi:MAG: formylglycine-generating enzyme family protein [Chloroflexales bacterium]|nr:formylglycine-generating enzyme family protein [Chloroflexales bacterium]
MAFSTTALGPNDPRFRGRQAALDRLLRHCQDEVTSYVVLYGGRQNGKTSLLLRLAAALRPAARVCWIDFQLIKGASTEDAFTYLADQITCSLPSGAAPASASDGPALQQVLAERLAHNDIGRFVLILDEWGALPAATRETLANALRSIFHTRLTLPALAKLQVVFSGGVELYDLVVTEAASLHNICEEVYLSDLAQPEAVALIADGLGLLGLDTEAAEVLGVAIYARVTGHPYLTQRIGRELERAYRDGATLAPDVIDAAVAQIQRGDSLLRRIRADLREYGLEDAARRLLRDPPPFTRLDDEMARLELLGLAKPASMHWAPRNPLLAAVFRDLLGVPAPAAEPTRVAVSSSDHPANDAQAVIAARQRRLAKLELTAARYGIDCPPHVTIEIEDLRRELAEIADAQPPAPNRAPAASAPASRDMPPPTAAVTAAATITAPTRHAIELIHIPAGPFLMGSSAADPMANSDEKPQYRLELPDYWIGKTPVTNAQFRPFVEGDGYRNRAYWTEAGWIWREKEQIGKPLYWDDTKLNGADYPMVGISWFEAVAYCRWLSAQTGQEFRLPSEAEWEKAARGPDGLIWPWGNTWEDGLYNITKDNFSAFGRTTPVGQYPDGASPYGVLDMAGNVWEWCATKYRKGYPYVLEDEWSAAYLEQDTGRMLRGGAFWGDQKYVRGAYRYDYYPRDRHYYVGLRVASHSSLPGSEF